MEFWLTGWDGSRMELPQTLTWKLCYGLGEPCDSFQLMCIWDEAAAAALGKAARFHAAEDGEKQFTGVVDECETAWGPEGGRLRIHGRGMAALLLDNEAVGADYQVATLADVLRDHVTPYGIAAAGAARLPAVPGFSVDTGSSEWAVLYRFARYHGGVIPWFDREGRLRLDGLEQNTRRIIGPETPVTRLALNEKRYGVLSEVLVRDRTGRGSRRVVDQTFLDQGGQRRKVLTLPRKSGYEAMRYSGEYQLQRSAEERRMVTLRAAAGGLAWPGELVEPRLERPKVSGIWRVRESETGVDAGGRYTELVLTYEGEN